MDVKQDQGIVIDQQKQEQSNTSEEHGIVFQYLSDEEKDIYARNRFCRPLILAHYSFHTGTPIMEAREKIYRENLWNEIGNELVYYLAGKDIEITLYDPKDQEKQGNNS